MILAIDPGNIQSAYVLLEEKSLKPIVFAKVENNELLDIFGQSNIELSVNHAAIEMVASYGMSVGKEVFDTAFWAGRFWEVLQGIKNKQLIYREDEKLNLCHTKRAKDANVIQALRDRFAYGVPNYGKGNRKNRGWFYGFKADCWQAYAVGVTYSDMYINNREEK